MYLDKMTGALEAVLFAAGEPVSVAELADLLQLVGQPRGVRIAAFELQQVLGVGPALAFLADAIGDRNPDVLEEHLVDLLVALGRAVQGRQRHDGDAGRVHLQQQE